MRHSMLDETIFDDLDVSKSRVGLVPSILPLDMHTVTQRGNMSKFVLGTP